MPESINTPSFGGYPARDATDTPDQDIKARAASTLGNAADKARQIASDVPGTVNEWAGEAANRLSRASDYVREVDPKDVWADVQRFVKARPAESLMAAAAIGFLLGRVGPRRV